MEVTHATNPKGSTDTIQQPLVEPTEPNLEAFLQNVGRLDGVQAEPKPDAFACTHNSCRLDEYLAQVHIDGFGTRTLCPKHVLDLVDREVGLDE